MPGKHHSINLLKDKELDFFSEFIRWTLTIGRILVIVTEIIALSAFVYRFSLDQRLIDLRSEIKQKQTIIAAQKVNEEKYRDLHNRLFLASNFSNLGMEKHKILKDILSLSPQGIRLNSLTLEPDILNIEANILISSSLSLFVNSLKNYPSIESISVDSIEHRPQTNFIFATITANLKKSQFVIENPSEAEEDFDPTLSPEGELQQ